MSEASKDESLPRSIRWTADEWQKLKDAADVLNEREHLSLKPTDIARSGAIRRAEEILAEQAETVPTTERRQAERRAS